MAYKKGETYLSLYSFLLSITLFFYLVLVLVIFLSIILIVVTLFCAVLFDCISIIIYHFFSVFTVMFVKGTWSRVDNIAAILGLQFMAQVTLFP